MIDEKRLAEEIERVKIAYRMHPGYPPNPDLARAWHVYEMLGKRPKWLPSAQRNITDETDALAFDTVCEEAFEARVKRGELARHDDSPDSPPERAPNSTNKITIFI